MWSTLVLEEFAQQAQDEAANGLVVTSHMCELDDPCRRAQVQAGFIKFVVGPAWKELVCVLPGAISRYQNVLDNLARCVEPRCD